MMNALIYLELARQLHRDRLDEAEAPRKAWRPRPERRHWAPKIPTMPVRWRPARAAT
jgi:hypothetical protein